MENSKNDDDIAKLDIKIYKMRILHATLMKINYYIMDVELLEKEINNIDITEKNLSIAD
jgi:hypothetical protein